MIQSYTACMASSSADDRLAKLITAATRVFANKGYRRTQMTDVAAELGVSAGNLYNYVESKEALFHACLLASSPAAGAKVPAGTLPLATPSPGAVLTAVQQGTRAIAARGALADALATDNPSDVAEELAGVIGDFYDRTYATRRFQALVEGAAADLPEVFEAFFTRMRRPALAKLTEYLERRIASGHLRTVPDPATTARLINETQAWFARHRLGDQDAADLDNALSRATVIDVLVAGLLPRPEPRRAVRTRTPVDPAPNAAPGGPRRR